MQMFFFLVLAAFLIYVLFSFLLPPAVEEEEEEGWDPSELRLESLLQGAVDPRLEIRERYRNRILSMGPGVIPRLTEALSQELFLAQNELRVVRLKELIGDFGLRAVPPLLRLLEEEGGDPEVARVVQELLIHIGPLSLRLLLERISAPTVVPLIAVLHAFGESARKAVLKAFEQNPQQSVWRRVLLSFGDDIVPGLLAALAHQKADVRDAAFKLLAELAPTQGKPHFLEGLRSSEPSLRVSALSALGQIGDPKTFSAILPMLSDENLQVRHQAVEALAKVGQEQAIAPLQNFLDESLAHPEQLESSLSAAVALAQLGQASSHKLIDRALQSNMWRWRLASLSLIERLPSDEALAYYERLLWDQRGSGDLGDWDERMPREAMKWLVKQHTEEAFALLFQHLSALESGHPHWLWAEEAFLTVKEHATSFLLSKLPNATPLMAGLILRVFLQCDDPRVVEPLLACMQSVEQPDLLWGIEPEDLLQFLHRVAGRCDLRDMLQRFLQKHGSSPLAPALQTFLSQLPPSNPPARLALETKSSESPNS